jgi:hypothetical protein
MLYCATMLFYVAMRAQEYVCTSTMQLSTNALWYKNVRKGLKFTPNNVKTKSKVSLLIGTDLPHLIKNDDMAPF